MKRLTETLKHLAPLAPQSVASATATTSSYVDMSGVSEAAFSIATGVLATGRTLTVQLLASDASDGTGAVKVAEQVFTAGNSLTAGLAVISYKPTAFHGRYVAVKFQHDAGSAVICGVTAALRQMEHPADNDWVLQV